MFRVGLGLRFLQLRDLRDLGSKRIRAVPIRRNLQAYFVSFFVEMRVSRIRGPFCES